MTKRAPLQFVSSLTGVHDLMNGCKLSAGEAIKIGRWTEKLIVNRVVATPDQTTITYKKAQIRNRRVAVAIRRNGEAVTCCLYCGIEDTSTPHLLMPLNWCVWRPQNNQPVARIDVGHLICSTCHGVVRPAAQEVNVS